MEWTGVIEIPSENNYLARHEYFGLLITNTSLGITAPSSVENKYSVTILLGHKAEA